MERSHFGGIEEHLQEQGECTRSVVWFGASFSCLDFMASVAPQDRLTQHSYIGPSPPYNQLEARQQLKFTTTLPPTFDLREAITLGYQNTKELVSEAGQESRQDASSLLDMLTMSKEHVIEIPPRTMLLKVMEAIGAKAEPIFTCTPCGSLHFKVCVELDVSGATFSDGKSPPIAKVEGKICDSPALAEISTVRKAFKYLGKAHSIQVLDYSSSIIQMIRLGNDWGDIDHLVYLLKKLIEQWDLSLKRCDRLSYHLDYHVIMDDSNTHGEITEASKVYTTLNDFIICIIKRYRYMPVYARSELEKIQDERIKYNETLIEKQMKNYLQGYYLQSIWFPEKDVLDYVLSYLVICKAEYNSVPSDSGKVEGHVKFSFPCMVQGKCHILEVHSRAIASSRAEEVATRAALLFMESKFNVSIVDLNYASRQTAENEYKSMECIIYRLIEVAHQMKTEFSNMVECIAGGCAAYSGDPRVMFGGPLCHEQMVVVEFCAKNVEVVRADCAMRAETVASMFHEMEKLSYSLD